MTKDPLSRSSGDLFFMVFLSFFSGGRHNSMIISLDARTIVMRAMG